MKTSLLFFTSLAAIINSCGAPKTKMRQAANSESWNVMLQNTLDVPVEVIISEFNKSSKDAPADWVLAPKTVQLAAQESKTEILLNIETPPADKNTLHSTRYFGSTLRFSMATLESYTVCQVQLLPLLPYNIRAKTDACAQNEIKIVD